MGVSAREGSSVGRRVILVVGHLGLPRLGTDLEPSAVLGPLDSHYFFPRRFGFTVSVTVVEGRRFTADFRTNCPVLAER